AGRQQIRELVGPLDYGNAAALEIFVETERDRFGLGFEAVEIEMKKRQASAEGFVDKGESRAGDIGIDAKPRRETLYELRLARAKIAAEREHVTGAAAGSLASTERHGFLRVTRNDRSHRAILSVSLGRSTARSA